MENQEVVLVTGGLGYIGSHTVVELMQKGVEVIVVDDLSNSKIEILDQIEKIVGDRPTFYAFNIGDKDKLTAIFDAHKIQSVVHFAAHLLVDESVEKPLKYYRNNVSNLINLLEVVQFFNCKEFIFSSSCTVYGEPNQLPVNESTPITTPKSPYGATKIMGEQILKDCVYSNAGLSVIALRYFNPVGAHKSGMLGELSQGTPKHLFPIINHSIEEDRPVLIFGDNYDTLDGTPVRDYIHVTDLALAHVSALSKLRNLKNQYRAYNIGTGKGLSVKEIIQAYAEILNKPIKHEILSRRTGDAEKIWADVERAEKELNWKAKNGLKEMILSSLKWEETQKDLFS